MNDSLGATHLNLTEAHLDFVDTLKQVASRRPIILHQNGKEVAALISVEDLHLLERLIKEEQDLIELVALLNQWMI